MSFLIGCQRCLMVCFGIFVYLNCFWNLVNACTVFCISYLMSFRSSFVTPLFCTEALTPFLELVKTCVHVFEVFVICEVIAYLAARMLFGFVVVNDIQFQSLLLYFDCFSDGSILKLIFVFFFPFLYN